MEYVITAIDGNTRRVISRHDNLDDAYKAGEKAYANAEKGEYIDCITGNISDDGTIEGYYKLIHLWY